MQKDGGCSNIRRMTASDLPQKPSAAPPDAPDSGSGRLTYEAVTADVRVTVRPVFLEEQSDPEEHQFLWAYHIRIENLGDKTVQLLSRHWRITDGLGQVHEVEGAGAVSYTPL
ncbi:MAG: ApaG domain, partial [Alphaproteobacteria bacterium]|nr:ApaG domain [Alphaproteobacteria bacterium]